MFGTEKRKGHPGGVAPCLQSVLSTSVLLSRALQTRPAMLCEMLRCACVCVLFFVTFFHIQLGSSSGGEPLEEIVVPARGEQTGDTEEEGWSSRS